MAPSPFRERAGERASYVEGENLDVSRHDLPPLAEGEGWGEGDAQARIFPSTTADLKRTAMMEK